MVNLKRELIGLLLPLSLIACGGQASPTIDSGVVCVDNVLCIKGTHWDSVQCKCVPG